MKTSNSLLRGCRMVGLALLLFFTSCVSQEKMVYLQSSEENSTNISCSSTQKFQLTIQPDDQLAISISSKYEELVMPFNNKTTLGQKTPTTQNLDLIYFLVDAKGFIEVPVLGSQYVKGMTCEQLRLSLEKQLKEGNHIKDAQVEVKLMSFKVAVLGEVKSPGLQNVTGERYTIIEALSQAGDLLPTGKRTDIKVVREENGARNTYFVDLTSNENVMNSPVYYLKQNDVVYVQPNKSIGVRGSGTLQTITAFSGIISMVLSVASIVIAVSK